MGKAEQTSSQLQYDSRSAMEEKARQIEQVTLQEQRRFNEMVEKQMTQSKILAKEQDSERKALLYKHQKTVDDLQTKVEDLNDSCNQNMQAVVHLESKERELSNQLPLVTKELELCQGNE